MPTYEYECSKCGHALEKFQSMSDKPLKKCPSCGANKLEKMLSGGAGLIFKGSGFYETDYKKRACPTSSSDKAACSMESSSPCSSCPGKNMQ